MSILFELERMERLLADLKALRTSVRIPVSQYLRKEGKEPSSPDNSTEEWTNCRIEEVWAALDSHRWYKTTVEIPEKMEGGHVELVITTGREGQWDATNPQMLIYVNDRLVQGVDVNHREILLSRAAKAGERFAVAILAYSGSVPGELILHTELVRVDDRTEKICYDFSVPIEAARLLKKHDQENYRRILVKLGPAADALDLRAPYSPLFYDSLAKVEEILKEEFYTHIDETAPVVSAVGHTHIDIAWLWSVEQTREKVVRSFSTVLELMDQYPNYRFMSSQPILYQFVKEQEPALYERIKERIREGRWETDGAMWLESDCNLPCGEALVRQIIKGEAFFETEFGIPSRCLWLPDVFGYSAAIPQILKQCGIPYFLTTKIAWNQFNQLPNDTFQWKGIDGSQVFVFMPTACDFDKTLGLNVSFTDTRNTTTYTGIVNPNMTLGTFKRFQNRDLTEASMMLFGFGDGGGGPTKEMLEEAERLQYGIPGIPRLIQESERSFLDRISSEIGGRPDMPTWEGELYFEYHRGTLTSMGKNKRNNRRSEMLYERLETMGVMAELHGAVYPKELLKKGWDIILLNQFHDIIPGSAIHAVYQQTDLEYEEILRDGETESARLAARIGGTEAADRAEAANRREPEAVDSGGQSAASVIVINTQGYERSDIAEVQEVSCRESNEKGSIVRYVENEKGRRREVQYTAADHFIFYAEGIPSAGYQTFTLCCEEDTAPEAKPPVWDGSFENSWYKAVFNERMELISLIEKGTCCELMKDGCPGNELRTFEDRPMNWDNWDLDIFYQKKPYAADASSVPVIKEWGPVRTVVSIRHQFLNSVVEQEIRFYHDLPRIDFVSTADWNDHHVLLRTNFPTDIHASRASYEIQFGNVERETTSNHSWDTAKFEVCAHKWVDLSENGLGLSLINDCKYGHSIKNGEMGLTLIKAGTYPDEQADIGHHEFTYSIYPHRGRWQDARTIELAYDLNSPLVTSIIPAAQAKHTKGRWSMVSIDQSNCFMEMVKKAEDGDGCILRLYENQNTRTPFSVRLGFEAAEVEECDLLERKIRPVPLLDAAFQDFIKPYEIKSYRLRPKA